MQRAIILVILLIGLTLSGGMAVLAWTRITRDVTPPPPTEDERRAARRDFLKGVVIPPLDLIDQDAQPFTNADLADGEHYTVLDFMFSHCRMACPIMSGNMLRIYNQTSGLPVRFVSITVDPANDTPERLRQYASKLGGVDTQRWQFLTGDEKQINRLVEALGFALTLDSASAPIPLDDGSTMTNIIHPTRFVLFGPDGEIIDSYNAFERQKPDTLSDMDRLLREIDELVRG